MIIIIILFWAIAADALQTRCGCLKTLSMSKDLETTSIQKEWSRKLFQGIRVLTATSVLFPSIVNAQRGAFEYDSEVYLKSLIGKPFSEPENRGRVVYESPRSVDPTLSNAIIDIVYDEVEKIGQIQRYVIEKSINDKIPSIINYFKATVPIANFNLADQYYVDILLFLIFSEAGNYIQSSFERFKLREYIGSKILSYLISNDNKYLLNVQNDEQSTSKNLHLMAIGIREILNRFKNAKFINDFTFEDENLTDYEYVKANLDQVKMI